MNAPRNLRYAARMLLVALSVLWLGGVLLAAHEHTSSRFSGPKANTGTVSHSRDGAKSVLTLSQDFVPPDTPDAHWQVVDSKGNVYLLDRLMIKPDKLNRSIVVPAFVRDVAKVQIWCAFAEANLGEATFATPVK